MSNRLPRALLADIAAVIGSGDHASALMMLADESWTRGFGRRLLLPRPVRCGPRGLRRRRAPFARCA